VIFNKNEGKRQQRPILEFRYLGANIQFPFSKGEGKQ